MMRLLSALWRVACWCVFALRFTAFLVHAGLQFVSKPGSRTIVFTTLHVLLLVFRGLTHPPLEPYFHTASEWVGFNLLFTDWVIDIVLFIALIPFWWLYGVCAVSLRPILGALPAPTRPLPPLARLNANEVTLTPVRVRLAVKRRHRTRPSWAIHAYNQLPPEIAALITPPARARSEAEARGAAAHVSPSQAGAPILADAGP